MEWLPLNEISSSGVWTVSSTGANGPSRLIAKQLDAVCFSGSACCAGYDLLGLLVVLGA